jgi:predicted Fe-Mo cluster-binding NifX family protein
MRQGHTLQGHTWQGHTLQGICAMPKVALTVHHNRLDAPLSPFFGKAQGLVILDPALPERTYLPNAGWSADWVCVTLLAHGVRHLICAYIDGRSMRRLERAGIDVRLAPCSRPAESLVDQFQSLRTAADGRASGPALATLDGVRQQRHA